MKTFFEIAKEVANMRWAIIDSEPSSFEEVELYTRQAVQQAHSYIWNLREFPFRVAKNVIILNKGQRSVAAPSGNIVTILVTGDKNYLKVQDSPDFVVLGKGKPEKYWVEFGNLGNSLNFDKIPDQNYEITICYETQLKARDKNNKLIANLENFDDVINISPEYEELYLNCLKNKAMCYLIVDDTDENYRPYQVQFQEQFQILKQISGVKTESYLVI